MSGRYEITPSGVARQGRKGTSSLEVRPGTRAFDAVVDVVHATGHFTWTHSLPREAAEHLFALLGRQLGRGAVEGDEGGEA